MKKIKKTIDKLIKKCYTIIVEREENKMTRKEEMMMEVIRAKGMEHADTLWFCKIVEMECSDDYEYLEFAKNLALRP